MKERGSITVFMSLCLSICLLLINTALESSRSWLLRYQLSRGVESALDSVFANYDGDLFSEFGILLLNTTDLPDFLELDELFCNYLEQELDVKNGRLVIGGNLMRETVVSVDSVKFTSVLGNQGKLFGRSVLDYMKYRSLTELIKKLADEMELLKQGDDADFSNEEGNETNELPEKEKEISEDIQQQYDELVEKSIIGKIRQLKKNGYLELIIPSQKIISNQTITASDFPSVRMDKTDGWEKSLLEEIGENVLYCQYLIEHFQNFTTAKKNEYLQYELEYILFGNKSDKDNLKACVDRLLLLREGMNLITIFRTPTLEAETEAFAFALAGWTGLAPVIELVKIAAAGVWAYGESMIDVRTLLGGGRIPVLKEYDDWTLSLEQLPELVSGRFLGASEKDKGNDYQEYLQLLLLLLDEQKKYYRSMDMVQCRLRESKPRFYMKECAYAVEVTVTASAKPLFLSFGKRGERGMYTWKISAVRMY